MEQRNGDAVEIDIKDLLFYMFQKWWLIAIVGIMCAIFAGLFSRFCITPTYTSTSKLYVINRQNEKITTWSDIETGTYLAKDFMILIKSRPVTEETIHNLKLSLTEEELASMITVNTPIDTRILNITVTYTDPQLAKSVVDEVARISSEQLVTIMEINKITIVEKGNLPISPSSPNISMNTVLGGALGALLTSVILIMIQLINDSIRTSEDVEKFLGLTTLGLIPKEEGPLNKESKKTVLLRKLLFKKGEKDA